MGRNAGLLLIIGVLIIISAGLNLVSAQKYISAVFEISENGFVNVEGEADVNPEVPGIEFGDEKFSGINQMLTRKEEIKWTFSLNLKEYEAISLLVVFPENTKTIENINTNLNYNIKLGKKISIEILDYEKMIDFSVDYKLEESRDYNWIVLILAFVIAGLVILLVLRRKKQVKRIDVIKEMLNEQEEKIVKLLERKPMRQKEIRKELDIPKASFSRYMYNLEKKKIIVREGEGKNKVVRLK